MSAPPPLYLNFYRKLAMIAKPSVGKGCWHAQEFLFVTISGILLTVIDRRNICAAEQIWYGYVPRPIPRVAIR